MSVFITSRRAVLVVRYGITKGPGRDGFGRAVRTVKNGGRKLVAAVRRLFPSAGCGVGFVFTAGGCCLSRRSGTQLGGCNVVRFSRRALGCCRRLAGRLKASTGCRLLKDVFRNRAVPRLSGQVPTVGNGVKKCACCSFSVRPRGLLGVNCILREGGTGEGLVPACRHLVGGSELGSIRSFISGKNFFPGSVVVGVSAGKGSIEFSDTKGRMRGDVSEVKVLRLPGGCQSTCVVSKRRELCNCTGSPCGTAGYVPMITFVGLREARRIGLFVRVGRGRGTIPGGLQGALGSSLL